MELYDVLVKVMTRKEAAEIPLQKKMEVNNELPAKKDDALYTPPELPKPEKVDTKDTKKKKKEKKKINSADLSAADVVTKVAEGRGLGIPMAGKCREDGGPLEYKGQKFKEAEVADINYEDDTDRGLGEPVDGQCREEGGPVEHKGQKGEKEREGRGVMKVETSEIDPRPEAVKGIADELKEMMSDEDLEALIAEIEGRPEEIPIPGETIPAGGMNIADPQYRQKMSAADLVRKSAEYEDLKAQLAGRGLDIDNLLISQSVGDAALNMDADSGNMEDYLMSNPEHLDTIQDNMGSEDLEGIEDFGKLLRDADPELYQ